MMIFWWLYPSICEELRCWGKGCNEASWHCYQVCEPWQWWGQTQKYSMKLRELNWFFSQNVVSKVTKQENRLTRVQQEYGIKQQLEIGRELQTYQKKGKNPSKPRRKPGCREQSHELIEASHLEAALTVTFSFGSRALVHPLSFNLLLLISTLLAEILSSSLSKAIAQTTPLQIRRTLENNDWIPALSAEAKKTLPCLKENALQR